MPNDIYLSARYRDLTCWLPEADGTSTSALLATTRVRRRYNILETYNFPSTSKRIVRANNRSIPAKGAGSKISTILLGGWAGNVRQAVRMTPLLPRSLFDIEPAAPIFVRRALGPAAKGTAEGGCVAEPHCVCNVFDPQVGIADVFDRCLRH